MKKKTVLNFFPDFSLIYWNAC